MHRRSGIHSVVVVENGVVLANLFGPFWVLPRNLNFAPEARRARSGSRPVAAGLGRILKKSGLAVLRQLVKDDIPMRRSPLIYDDGRCESVGNAFVSRPVQCPDVPAVVEFNQHAAGARRVGCFESYSLS